jgi:uncharacterized protein (TIGR02722 family)
MKKLSLISLALLVLGTLACNQARQVNRVDTSTQIDLSGRWNDTDSRLAAEELTTQFMSMNWIPDFRSSKGRKPILVVGIVRNKSHEHIDAETFIKDLEKSVVKSGTLSLVQAGDKRNDLRTERAEQQEFATAETKKKWGQELGADFMLQGSINSIIDKYGKEQVVLYQIDLELTNVETNEIIWMGDKKIKKYIKN